MVTNEPLPLVRDVKVDVDKLLALFDAHGIVLHETQRYVFRRFFETPEHLLLYAGRRWGKSFFNGVLILAHIMTYPQPVIWVVAPERWQAQKVCQYAAQFATKLGFHAHLDRGEEVLLRIEDVDVLGKVSANRRGLAGEGLTLVIDDEAALSTGEHWYYFIKPALLDHGGRAIFTSSDYHASWLDELVERKEVEVVVFPSWANPYLDKRLIARDKETLPPHLFDAMYGGRRSALEGLAFPHQPIVSEVSESEFIGNPVVGLDWGHYEPFAAVLMRRLRNGKYYVENEIYRKGLTPREQVFAVRQMLSAHRLEIPQVVAVADASTFSSHGSISIADQWAREGLSALRATRDLTGSLQLMLEILARGELIVHPRCTELLREMRQARVELKKPSEIVGDDHAIDAVRYGLPLLTTIAEEVKIPVGSLLWLEQLAEVQRIERGGVWADW